jgi:hypothetical protein
MPRDSVKLVGSKLFDSCGPMDNPTVHRVVRYLLYALHSNDDLSAFGSSMACRTKLFLSD